MAPMAGFLMEMIERADAQLIARLVRHRLRFYRARAGLDEIRRHSIRGPHAGALSIDR